MPVKQINLCNSKSEEETNRETDRQAGRQIETGAKREGGGGYRGQERQTERQKQGHRETQK